MIYYLIYTSHPCSPIDRSLLEDIANESSEYNSKKEITGILLGVDGMFIQYLEGEEGEIKTLYEKLKKDSRHKEVICWIRGYSNERVFEKWAMASWFLTNKELEELVILEDLRDFLENPLNEELQSKKFMTMINSLIKTWIAHESERLDENKEGV